MSDSSTTSIHCLGKAEKLQRAADSTPGTLAWQIEFPRLPKRALSSGQSENLLKVG